MHCTECGALVSVAAKFCRQCGTPVISETVTDSDTAAVPSQPFTDAPASPPADDVAAPNLVLTDSPLRSEPPFAPRPWVRFWAKQIDLICVTIPIAFVLGFLFPVGFSQLPDAVLNIIFVLAWVVIEPLVLSQFSTTPGRALLRTQLVYKNGRSIPLDAAYSRTFSVYIKGMGLGIPIVALFTQISAYKDLKRDGKTSWDREGGFEVRHKEIGAGRIIIAVVILLLMAALAVYGTMAEPAAY
jgi:uncharacterized RDD family membrane protein YckC